MGLEEYDNDWDVVLVLDEGVLGVVLEQGAHFSTVLYFIGGLMFQEILENEEFLPLDELREEDE